MRCLVIGGAGFIGSHIVDALIAAGYRVRVFDRPNISLDNLKGSIEKASMANGGLLDIHSGDFSNFRDLSSAVEGMDVVIHLACTTLPGPSNENPIYDVESNLVGTLHLLDRAVEKGVRKIIFASSGGTVYGVPTACPIPEDHPTNPQCSYGITKLAIEKYLGLYRTLHDLETIVLRLGNPYGERQRIEGVQGAIAVFLGKALFHRPIDVWGDGSVARDYFYISDLVSAFLGAIKREGPSRVYNIGSGKAVSLNEILSVIKKVTGREIQVAYTEKRQLDVPVNCLDIRRAASELGWTPTVSLEEGVDRTWRWLLKTYRNGGER